MWRLAGNTATWHCNQLRASLELQHPERGLGGIAFQGQPLHETALFQMYLAASAGNVPIHLEDCYVRGTDLVAAYADADRHVCPEFCWRVCPGLDAQAGTLMVEAIISTQTELLDSDPAVDVRCRLSAKTCDVLQEPNAPAENVFSLSQAPESVGIDCGPRGCAMVFHLAEGRFVFAQIFHSADVVQARLERDLTSQVMTSTVSFFGGRVEKGVIRRTWLRGILAPDDQASCMLAKQWNDMLVSPPPLAT